jgi:cation:H+ antiporter
MPDMTHFVIQILMGLVVLVAGGELLVRGATALAAMLRISPVVIGLTVVAFGTSAPELAVTVQAAYVGSPDLALGNVVGSNIANVLLILGLSALAAPLAVSSRLVRVDVPLVLAASLALYFMGRDGAVDRLDGALLFAALLVYLVWSVREGRAEGPEAQLPGVDQAQVSPPKGVLKPIALVVLGLVLLAFGADALVTGAVGIARVLGVSDLVIGLTVVAVGTSLPELAASVIASLRGQRDIAVGNVVGSSLFNILGVLGLGSLAAPSGIPVAAGALAFDIPVMILTALACLPIFFTWGVIRRWEGALFLGYYIAYVTYLVLTASGSPAVATFSELMLWVAAPLTVLVLGISLARAIRAGSGKRPHRGA